MSALTADFDSNIRNSRGFSVYPTNATAVLIAQGVAGAYYRGQVLQLNSAGEAVPGAVNVALKVVGRNAGISPDGLTVRIEEGDIILNTTGTAPVQANNGAQVKLGSDNEVTMDAGSTNAVAGILVGMEGTQARVRVSLEASL